MIGHIEDVLRQHEIDVAHIDHSLTYRENCQLLQQQFGVEFVKSNNAKLDRAEMLARMYHNDHKPEKARKDPYTKPAEKRPLFAPTPAPLSLDMPFDPIKRCREIEAIVMKGNARLYDSDKFRYQRFYGGIATAGSRGCPLRCLFCWNFDRNDNPVGAGTFFSPYEVVDRLEGIAKRNNTDLARISGSENFLGMRSAKHLYEVIANSELSYVVETNAIMLGYQPRILDLFKDLRNFRIRLSYKASNGLQWEKLTGSNVWGFAYQQAAIREIQKRHIPLKVAFMPQFVNPREIDVSGYILEEETMKYYPGVKARLDNAKIKVLRRGY